MDNDPAIGAIVLTGSEKVINLCVTQYIQLCHIKYESTFSDFPIKLLLLTNTFHQAFAAGADIKEMQHRDFASNYRENFLEWWSNITLIRWTKHDRDSLSNWDIVTGNFRKPIIAAVNGYALGGGCEVSCLPFSSRVQNVVPHGPWFFHHRFRMLYPIASLFLALLFGG